MCGNCSPAAYLGAPLLRRGLWAGCRLGDAAKPEQSKALTSIRKHPSTPPFIRFPMSEKLGSELFALFLYASSRLHLVLPGLASLSKGKRCETTREWQESGQRSD